MGSVEISERVKVAQAESKWLSDQVVSITDGGRIDFECGELLAVLEPHIQKARDRRKLMLEPYQHVYENILDKLQELKHEKVITFDKNAYTLREAFCHALFENESEPLEQLHTKIFEDRGKKKDRPEKFELLRPFLNETSRNHFQNVFEKFVHEVVLPDAYSSCNEDSFYYQAFPCIRVVRPREFSIGIHADVNYGFNPSNINYYVPLTDLYDSNSLHVESEIGKEDWHTLTYGVGDIYRFHGAMCMHFTTENRTDISRLSLDFRVIPASCFLPVCPVGGNVVSDHFSSKSGYYVKAVRKDDGSWERIDELPIPDVRNGFPFTNK